MKLTKRSIFDKNESKIKTELEKENYPIFWGIF